MANEQQKKEYPPQLKWMQNRALEDPEGFWGEVAEELHWFKRWDRVFEWKYPFFKWFVGGLTNISYNCLDYHIKKGKGNRAAVIWESGESEYNRVLTYNELLYQVERAAAALKGLGVEKGDRVTIYMPMIPEALIAMLATTRIGAIHSVVFGGFGAGALAERIEDAESKLVFTADVGYRRGKAVKLKDVADEALGKISNVEKVIVVKRHPDLDPSMKQKRDIFWKDAMNEGKGINAEAVPMDSNDLAYILHTSGTTAKPKGTVQPHGSYQVYVYAMGKWMYDMNEDDIWWSTTDVGWIVGHSYVVYAPLLFGCSTVMYEGVPDHPSPGVWWKIIEKHGVNKLWTSPTAIRALMKHGNEWPKRSDLSSLEVVFSAGEVLNPPAWHWLQKIVLEDKIPVIDHMWQTESSGPMIGNPYGIVMLPIKPGSATIALPGIEGDVVDGEGNSLAPNVEGNFVCRRPFPGLTPTLWRDEERYAEVYWRKIPKCYYTGDAATKDEDGYFWFVGRMDEVIKIAAHRIGTIEIENVLLSHPGVAEAAVVGKPDPIKGEVAAAFVVLKENYEPSDQLIDELRGVVRKSLGPIVIVSDVIFVSKVPKTRSGKIMRRLIKSLLAEKPLGDYSTIEDITSIDEIKKSIEELKK